MQVCNEAEQFGCNQNGLDENGTAKSVQVEFVSANPTGPLHVGHGRGAAIGDSLSRLLVATGWSVHREFYYNDAGQQNSNLALSGKARIDGLEPSDKGWPKDGYQGSYIKDDAAAYLAKETVNAADRQVVASGNANDLDEIQLFAVAWLRREQDEDLKAFDVNFDHYFLESSLYKSDAVQKRKKIMCFRMIQGSAGALQRDCFSQNAMKSFVFVCF